GVAHVGLDVAARLGQAAAAVLERGEEDFARLADHDDDVALGQAGAGDALALGGFADGANAVANGGGFLELERVGVGHHALFERGDGLAVAPLEEAAGALDEFGVFVVGDVLHARRAALADLVQDARARPV